MRRLGEMLKETPKATGGASKFREVPGRNRTDLVPKGNQVDKPTLSDFGLTKKVSMISRGKWRSAGNQRKLPPGKNTLLSLGECLELSDIANDLTARYPAVKSSCLISSFTAAAMLPVRAVPILPLWVAFSPEYTLTGFYQAVLAGQLRGEGSAVWRFSQIQDILPRGKCWEGFLENSPESIRRYPKKEGEAREVLGGPSEEFLRRFRRILRIIS